MYSGFVCYSLHFYTFRENVGVRIAGVFLFAQKTQQKTQHD